MLASRLRTSNKIAWTQTCRALWQLMRFHKPIGILLLLWPTLWGLWFAAQGLPPLKYISIFCCGVIIMRASGCIINDIADRNIDGLVQRTRLRPLVTQQLTLKAALLLLFFMLSLALVLTFFLNKNTFYLAVVAFAVAMVYPYSKRFTYFPQAVLGVAFSMGIPMAFTALGAAITVDTGILFLIGVIWCIAYDTFYALTDLPDDQNLPIYSTALFFKEKSTRFIAILQGMSVILWLLLAYRHHFGASFYVCLVLSSILMVWQHWYVRCGQREHYFQAFLNNHWVGFLLWVGVAISF